MSNSVKTRFTHINNWDVVPLGAEVLYHLPDSQIYHLAWFQRVVEEGILEIAMRDAKKLDERMTVLADDVYLAEYGGGKND